MARDGQRQGAEDRASAPGLPRRPRRRLRPDRRALSVWKVTVRIGPKVERSTHPDRGHALDVLEARAVELSRTARSGGIDLKYKRYEPGERVSARIELAGPQRLLPSVRAGVDIHGDGSTQAYVGRMQRRPVEARKGETAAEALRRELED